MEIFSSMNEFVNKNKDIHFIIELNKVIEKMGLTMVYEGRIDQDIIKVIASTVEKKLNDEKESIRLQKLLFHVIIEFLQNISKYSDDTKKGKGIIIVGKTIESYYVSAGNVIKKERKKNLCSSIDLVNSLNLEEINNLYESKMKNGFFNMNGGAGLGLIDVVKKTKQKLLYNFEELNDLQLFFLITATILKENK